MKRFWLNLMVFFVMIFEVNAAPCYAQTIYTWNKTGSADWTAALNWMPARTTPATDDILVFNNGATVTLINVPAQNIGQLSISNNTMVNLQAAVAGNILTITGLATGDDLTILSGSSLNVNGTNTTTIFVATGATANIAGNITFSAAAHRFDAADANGISFNSPAIFTQEVGCSGNIFTASGKAKAVVFNTGTTFIQKAGANPFALTQPSSKVVFNTGSLFKVQQSLFLSFSGRTYANMEIDYPGFNQSALGVNPLTIQNLTITQGTLSLDLTADVTIQGNIAVASGAALNFNPATAGALYLSGSSIQTITNAGALTFNNKEAVNFNNPSGITISNNLTLSNLVHFTMGIVTLPNPAVLTLDATATVTGVSNNSFADGLVKKNGNTAFIFPVGKTGVGYVPIGISAPGATTDAFTAEYKRTGATTLSNNYTAGLDHVSGVDYWNLNRTNGTSPVDVTFYWTSQSSSNGSALYINDISKLVIAHYNGSTQWDNYGGSYNTGSGFAAGSITWAGVNNFSAFSLGSTDVSNPLPVKLDYFNGIKQGNKNYLSWKVTCTSDAIMSVERSRDANNFTKIKEITASTVRCLQPFNYTDEHPLTGINYYRLKMVDANGKILYSTIIALLNKESRFDIVSLMPNVITSSAVLNVTASENTIMEVVVTDVTGKQVQKITCHLVAGNNHLTINFSGLAAGAYQIRGYTADGASRVIRFIKP